MKAKILINDLDKRFKSGKVGVILFNDSTKYDYRIALSGFSELTIGETKLKCERVFYFYKNEVKLFP